MAETYTYQNHFPRQDFRLFVEVLELHTPTIKEHAHEFSELVVILAGQARHWINGEEYPLSAGDVFVIKGNDLHAFYDAGGLRVCNMLYDPDQFLRAGGDVQRLPGFHALFYLEPHYRSRDRFQSRLHLTREEMPWLAEMIARMQAECQERAPGYESMLRASFNAVLVYVSRLYSRQRDPAAAGLLRLSKVLSHLEEHIDEPLNLDGLARLAHMSKNHLLRVFKQCYKTTPGDYLIRLRLARAVEMMRLPGRTLTEIAFAAGFGDSNYFSRQFRKIYGQTPREFRQALLADTAEARKVTATIG
jgi:AraC-like DNA-binding protein